MSVLTTFAAVTAGRVLDVVLTPFVVLGTFSTFWSGLFAAAALATGLARDDRADLVNIGLAAGFIMGMPFAALALAVDLLSS